MKVLDINENRAIIKVFLAPSVISPEALSPIREKFEQFLAELSIRLGINAFLKRIFRAGDYYALVAVETGDYEKVVRVGNEIERRTRILSSRLKRFLSKAIEFF